MKKLKNTTQKTLLTFSCVFAFLLAAVACIFALGKTTTAFAASNGVYGEITLNKTTADGYSYQLIIAGHGYTGTGFVTGSDVSIYVSVDETNESGKTTFVDGNWNYMLSSLAINEDKITPNQRIALVSNNSFNQNAGAYALFENGSRYLVHTLEVGSNALSISAEFSFVERISVSGYHNNEQNSKLNFVYNAINGENLDTITGSKYLAVAQAQVDDTANHFDGFFDAGDGSKLYPSAITRAASALDTSKTTSYKAQSYSTKEITIGTTTISPTANEIGGTAYVSTNYAFLGNNTTTTKYFVSGETEAFVLFSGSHTFTAQAADGYTFLGWFSGTDIQTATKIDNPATTTETTIIAVFAKTYNITLETPNASVSDTEKTYISGKTEICYYGQQLSLTASSEISNPTFLGWYKNGTKVESSKTYAFTVQENCTLSAIFSSAISLDISIEGQAQIAGVGTTTLNLNQTLASALELSYQNQDGSTTTLTLANGGLIYSNGKLSCTIPAGKQITLTFSHGSEISVSEILLSEALSLALNQTESTTTAQFNAVATSLKILIPLQAQAEEKNFSSYTTNVTYASTLSGTKNWVMFTIAPFSGYTFLDAKIEGISITEFCGELIDADALNSLNNKLYGSTEGKYLSFQNLYEILTTGQTSVNGQEITLVVETAKTNTITLSTTCGSNVIATNNAGIIEQTEQGTTLVKTAQVANGSSFSISAQNTINVGGTTYIFSHFLLGGNYLAGRANANGQAIVVTTTPIPTTTLTLTSSGSAEFCAVYRKANSISAQVKINSQVQSTTNAISATAFGGTAFDFALLPTNEQITITDNNKSASVTFSKFILTINGKTQEIKSTEFSLILAENDEVSLVAQYVKNIDYSSAAAQAATDKDLIKVILTYNGDYEFKASGQNSVYASSNSVPYGEQVSFSAKPDDDFVFVGWARVDKGSTPTFADITEFSSTFTTTADDSKCVVAVFAQTIQISVVSSSGANTTITNTKTDEQTTNHMFTYAGAPLSLSNAGENFIGYYNMGDLMDDLMDDLPTRLSESSPYYEFLPTDSQNIVALFGNNTLQVSVATNFGSATEGGTFSVTFSDGRDELFGQTETTQVFATQHRKNITLKATANDDDGYTFVGWFESTATSFASPISTNAELAVEQVGSRSLVAHFAQKVNVLTSISGQGIISGLPQNVYMGQTLNISATALDGYKFDSLTIKNNGSPVAVSNNSATFVVAGDITIAATFESRPLVSVGAFVMQPENCPIIVGGSVPSTITINSEITKNAYVDSGATATITVTVSEDYQEGYQFVDFLVNGIAQNAASTTLTLSNITANTAVVAVYQKLVSVSTSVQTNNPTGTSTVGGSISVSTALANGKGIVGSTYTFTAAANAGYEFSGFVIDGNFVPTASTESSISLCLADNNTTITAVFTKLITITTTITGSGSIKINGEPFTSGSTLPYGQVATIEFEPTSGYILTAVSGISITTNDGKSGFFTPTTALNISATYTQKSKLTLTTNNDSVKWDYNVPIIEVDYDNVVYGGASYNGPFGYTQILIGGSFVVPTGTNITLTAPFTTDDNSKVFVGFFINDTTSFVGTNYTFSAGKVTATYTLSENTTILARYEDATTIVVRSANGTTIDKYTNTDAAKDKFSLAISDNPEDSAGYVISAGSISGDYLTLTVPKTLPLTITAKGNNFTGWYFAANQTGQFYYNYNKVSNQSSFSFIASELSGFASGYALLAGYNVSETDEKVAPGTSASATLEQNANGTATASDNTITATASSEYHFAYWEVKIAVAASNLYIAIPGESTITATASGSILTIKNTNNTTTYYSGYATAIRPVFKQGPAPITPQEIVPTTYSVEVSSAFGTANFTYNQVVAGSNITITINGLTNGQYVSISGSLRAYLTGFSATGSTGTRSNNSYTITSVNANTIVVANFELRANVNGEWVALGSTQTTTAERQTTGASNVVSLFTGFTANALFKPNSVSYSDGTTTFSFILTNSITTATATRSAKMVTISSSESSCTIYTPFGSTTSQIDCYTDANGNLPLVALASADYAFVSYSDSTGASKSTSAADVIEIGSTSSITALFAQKAKLLLVSNAESTTATITGTIAIGQTPTIEVSASYYSFKRWSTNSGTTTGTTNTITYQIPASSIITLTFAKQHLLTATADGNGSISVSPALIEWGDHTMHGKHGTTYTFTATPANDNYIFTGWKVNNVLVSSNENDVLVSSNSTLSITLTGDTAITAVFESKNAITIPANSLYITSFGTVGQAIVGEDVSTNYNINLSHSEKANVLVRAHYNNVLKTVSETQSEVLGKTGVFVTSVSSAITAIEQSRDLPVVLATSNIADVQIIINGSTITYSLPADAASSFEVADQNNLNRVLVFEGWYENGEQKSTADSYAYAGVAVEARFAEYFRLSKHAPTNGTITISTEAEAKGTNFDFYPAGASISVQATASENYFAKSLTINNQVLQGAQATLAQTIGATFALSSSTTLEAEFGELVTLIFNISDTLNRSTIGGTISVSSSSLPQALTSAYYDQSPISVKIEKGSSVVVVFNPILGNTLVEVVDQTLTGNTLTFTANTNQTFSVKFEKTYSAQSAAISLDGIALNAVPTITQTNNSISVSALIQIQITENETETDYKLIAIAVVSESGKIEYHYLDSLSKTDTTATLENLNITQNIIAIAIYGKKLQIAVSSTDNIAEIAVPQNIYQNDTITLTAPEVENHTFIGWYLQNQNVLSLISTSTEYKFIAQQSINLVARYATKYVVNISVHKATRSDSGEIDIASSSADSNVGSVYGNGTYLSTGSITLYAHAANGYKFVGWYTAENELVSESAIYTTTAQTASIIAKAVFERVYSTTIKTNLNSSVIGATIIIKVERNGEKIYQNGTYAATTTDNQVVIQNLTNGSRVLVRSQANGYTLATDMSAYNTDDDGNYIVPIQGANISLDLSYTPSKNVLTVESSTKYLNEPESAGSFKINGTLFDPQNPTTEFDSTKSFTFAITLPKHNDYSYIAQIYKNGVLAETLNADGSYSTELSSSATINVVFSELVNVSVETTDGNDGTIYINGTQTTSASVPLGSIVTIYATNGTQYEFVKYTQNSTKLSTHPTYTFTASESKTITAEFALKQIEFAVYFPANVRTAIDSTGSAPTPVLNIYKSGTIIATINSSFIEQTIENIKIKVDGDFVIISVPYGYNDGEITAQFEQATKRADITLNNTTISSANTIPASFNILVGEATTNKTIMLSYTLYAAITITSDGRVGIDPQTGLAVGDSFIFTANHNTSITDNFYASQVYTAFFPVGTTYTLAATKNNETYYEEISGSKIYFDFDNFIVLSCPYLPYYILELGKLSESDSFYQWQNGSTTRPARQAWINLINTIGYTTLSSDKYLVTADATLVADYLNLTENGNNHIFALLNNNLTNGSFDQAQQREINGGHASTSVFYAIIPESQKGNLSIIADPNGSFNQAGLTNNDTYTASNNTIQSGEENTAISLISKYSNISEATYQAATKKATSNSSTTYEKALQYSGENNYTTKPIAATYYSLPEEPQQGLTFLGYYIKATNFGSSEIQGTTTAFSIKPDNKTIIDSTGSPVSSLQNYIKIADPSAINVVGPYEVVALFELNLYQITTAEHAANKTTTNASGKQQIKINDTTYIISDKEIKADGYSYNLYKEVPDASDLFQGIEKVDDYYIVYTNETSHSGRIKGSLVYEHGDTTSINAYIHLYGEFAGYQFATDATATSNIPSNATITTNETIKEEYSNPNKAILQPNRNENNVAYSTQDLGFEIVSDQNLNIYFTGLRYKVTLQFVEYTNQTDDTQVGAIDATNEELALLFNETSSTAKTTESVDPAFFNLGNIYNYVSYKSGMLNKITEGEQEIFSLNVTSNDNEIGEIVLKPQINGNQVSASFYIEARAGIGFAGFNLAYTNANVVGRTYIISPEDNEPTQTYDFNDQKNKSTFTSRDYSYNADIDCETNEELMEKMQQSLTLYLVQNCSMASINVNNGINNGELREIVTPEYTTYNPRKPDQETGRAKGKVNVGGEEIDYNITNGVNIVVVKGANKFKTMLESYSEDGSLENIDSMKFILGTDNYSNVNSINEKERELLSLYAEVLSIPYVEFIKNNCENNYINCQTLSAQNFFDFIESGDLTFSDLVGEISYKIRNPETGRYIELKLSGENFQLKEKSTITSKTDYNKWSAEDKTEYNLTYDNHLITISYNQNGETVSMSAPLIVSINYTLTSTVSNQWNSIIGNDDRQIEIQLIKLPDSNNNIPATQDDMVFAVTSINSVAVPEVIELMVAHKDDNWFITGCSYIAGGLKLFGGATVASSFPAHVSYLQTELSFGGVTNQSNTNFVFASTGNGYIGRAIASEYRIAKFTSLWELVSLGAISDQLSQLAIAFADSYETDPNKCYEGNINTAPLTLVSMLTLDRETINQVTNSENNGQIKVCATNNELHDVSSTYDSKLFGNGLHSSTGSFTLIDFPYKDRPFSDYSKAEAIGLTSLTVIERAIEMYFIGKTLVNGVTSIANGLKGFGAEALAAIKGGAWSAFCFAGRTLIAAGKAVISIIFHPFKTFAKFIGKVAIAALKVAWPAVLAAAIGSLLRNEAQSNTRIQTGEPNLNIINQYLNFLKVIGKYDKLQAEY